MALNKKTGAFTGMFVLFLSLSLIAGCGGFSKGKDTPPTSAAFAATGTEGIVMTFTPEQPPVKSYTQAPLNFMVEVRNKGTTTVPSAMFYLSGFDATLIPVTPNPIPLPQPLEGKTQFNPDGGYTLIQMGAQNINLPNEMPNYKPNFLLTACYPYKTFATPMVCVDPNPTDTVSDKACQVQKVIGTGSQGAPVAVESIETQATPRGMFFRIHIANVGSGTSGSGLAFDQMALGACPGALTYNDLNKIKYMVTLGSNEPVACQPINNEVRLVNNKATIFCQSPKSIQPLAYQTPLKVELIYGYKNSVAKMVEVENLNFGRI
ncbi:TPA: hypothetical protein HA265_04945 [Candidatus Woesearchaeota archaeon]|nr:hypothetical protein [Candidatus Woesearchaeota archaeon]